MTQQFNLDGLPPVGSITAPNCLTLSFDGQGNLRQTPGIRLHVYTYEDARKGLVVIAGGQYTDPSTGQHHRRAQMTVHDRAFNSGGCGKFSFVRRHNTAEGPHEEEETAAALVRARLIVPEGRKPFFGALDGDARFGYVVLILRPQDEIVLNEELILLDGYKQDNDGTLRTRIVLVEIDHDGTIAVNRSYEGKVTQHRIFWDGTLSTSTATL